MLPKRKTPQISTRGCLTNLLCRYSGSGYSVRLWEPGCISN